MEHATSASSISQLDGELGGFLITADWALVHFRTKSLRNSFARQRCKFNTACAALGQGATVGILVLAIVGSWLTMSPARFLKDSLAVPNTGAVIFVLILIFVVPSVVSTAVCHSVAVRTTVTPIRSAVVVR